MATATDKQVRDLEKAMTDQFYYLVQGSAFRIAIARKYGLDSTAFKNYNAVFVPLVNKWVLREIEYEKENLKHGVVGPIAKGNLTTNDFYYSEQLPKLNALVQQFNAEKKVQGIGFIPLLIWAVIAIAGFFTVQKITDDLTTTTQEKESLLKTTAQTAKELNLTPDQATALVTQTQEQASEGTGLSSTIKWGLGAAALIILGPKILESFSHSKS